ncbi:hypothetical protein [Helicobacter mustelae]|uniref:hypothetical protein n=1 Tax=Helicobacter mustelae TaxID=217 RepID=UPI00032163C3|nr:hypothetical protein [Helicobacter mustelae]
MLAPNLCHTPKTTKTALTNNENKKIANQKILQQFIGIKTHSHPSSCSGAMIQNYSQNHHKH